jgi:hypothetical protein
VPLAEDRVAGPIGPAKPRSRRPPTIRRMAGRVGPGPCPGFAADRHLRHVTCRARRSGAPRRPEEARDIDLPPWQKRALRTGHCPCRPRRAADHRQSGAAGAAGDLGHPGRKADRSIAPASCSCPAPSAWTGGATNDCSWGPRVGDPEDEESVRRLPGREPHRSGGAAPRWVRPLGGSRGSDAGSRSGRVQTGRVSTGQLVQARQRSGAPPLKSTMSAMALGTSICAPGAAPSSSA